MLTPFKVVCKNKADAASLRKRIRLTLFKTRTVHLKSGKKINTKWWLIAVVFISIGKISLAQHPGVPMNAQRPPSPPVYLLNLSPVKGGKTYTLYRNSKVRMELNNGTDVRGKVRNVSRDSVYVTDANYAIADLSTIRYNPGTALGVAAAIGACVGIAAIAFTANGGQDGERSDTENAIFWTGVGVAATGLIISIPTYFIKKKFTREEYDFRTIQIGGY